jgi:hypothetical protein
MLLLIVITIIVIIIITEHIKTLKKGVLLKGKRESRLAIGEVLATFYSLVYNRVLIS